MNLQTAKRLAESEMHHHGLIAQGWTFQWIRAKGIKGQCDYMSRQIRLSRPLTEIRDEAGVRMTILHEIAHALVGVEHRGHGPVWSRKFRELGGSGTRVTGDPSITAESLQSLRKWRIKCSVGGETLGYCDRKGKVLARSVCREHDAQLEWIAQN